MSRTFRSSDFGTVISGTMRSQDLLPAFMDKLRDFDPEVADAMERELSFSTQEDKDEVVIGLFDRLNEYCPSGVYFGSHPGDGSDYGFWIHESFFEDFDGLKVSDTSEVPSDYSGEVLHVNDHGNATLYVATEGKLEEVWSVV